MVDDESSKNEGWQDMSAMAGSEVSSKKSTAMANTAHVAALAGNGSPPVKVLDQLMNRGSPTDLKQ